MDTLTSIFAMPAVQSALIAALSHVVVWAAKKVTPAVQALPGGYSSAKRAVAVKLIGMLAGAAKDLEATKPAAPEAAKNDTSHLNAPN